MLHLFLSEQKKKAALFTFAGLQQLVLHGCTCALHCTSIINLSLFYFHFMKAYWPTASVPRTAMDLYNVGPSIKRNRTGKCIPLSSFFAATAGPRVKVRHHWHGPQSALPPLQKMERFWRCPFSFATSLLPTNSINSEVRLNSIIHAPTELYR